MWGQKASGEGDGTLPPPKSAFPNKKPPPYSGSYRSNIFASCDAAAQANGGKIAISVYDAATLEGYQIKGTAQYLIEGEIVNTFKAMVEAMFKGAATAKGALVITPEKVIVTTPGADNKKEL